MDFVRSLTIVASKQKQFTQKQLLKQSLCFVGCSFHSQEVTAVEGSPLLLNSKSDTTWSKSYFTCTLRALVDVWCANFLEQVCKKRPQKQSSFCSDESRTHNQATWRMRFQRRRFKNVLGKALSRRCQNTITSGPKCDNHFLYQACWPIKVT